MAEAGLWGRGPLPVAAAHPGPGGPGPAPAEPAPKQLCTARARTYSSSNHTTTTVQRVAASCPTLAWHVNACKARRFQGLHQIVNFGKKRK